MILGQKYIESIIVKPNLNVTNEWYSAFNDKIIKKGFIEVEKFNWEKAFIFTSQEKIARQSPAQRAIRQALISAGMIKNLTVITHIYGFKQFTYLSDNIINLPSMSEKEFDGTLYYQRQIPEEI